MNRNRKENARKKISKRVFIQCRAFFSCVFFLGTNRVFFSIALIRFAEKKINLNEKKETWNAYASIVHRMKCRVSKIFKTAFYDI